MEPLAELRQHEYDGAYDPTLPISDACRTLLASVEALRAQFREWTADLEKRAIVAREAFELVRGDAEPIDLAPRMARIQYMAPPVKQPRFVHAFRAMTTCEAARRRFAGNMILALVAAFDTFEADLMRAAFKMRPEILDASQQDIPWRDINHLADMAAVHGLVVERDIEASLRKSHAVQLSTLASRFGLKDLTDMDELPQLIEITERRNLYAHQGGRITAHYLSQTNAPASLRPGEHLSTNQNYFDDACNIIAVVAVKMTQSLWRTIGGRDLRGAADRDLSQIAYEYILSEQWTLAVRILKFAWARTDHSSEQHKLVIVVNYAQVYKWMGNDAACESLLNKIDWDAKDQAFQLSRSVLLEDYEEAARLMIDAGSINQVRRSAFDYWPIYRHFRTTGEYRRAYRCLYGEPPPRESDDDVYSLGA